MDTDSQFLRDLLHSVSDGVYFVDAERRVTFWSEGAARLTGFTSEEVLGKPCADGILCHVNDKGEGLCEAGCAFDPAFSNGEESEVQAWLRHSLGHRVPVRVRTSPMRDTTGAVVGAAQVFTPGDERAARRARIEELEEMAFLDPLTKVGNRRWAETVLRSRLDELDRYSRPFGVLFVDLDQFKSVNDRFGHAMGDRALQIAARTLTGTLRPFDACCRWGGEEFLIIAVNVTCDGLLTLADRLRGMVRASAFREFEDDLKLTVSIGAALAEDGDTPESIVARADGKMYESKRAGGDRVTL